VQTIAFLLKVIHLALASLRKRLLRLALGRLRDLEMFQVLDPVEGLLLEQLHILRYLVTPTVRAL